MTLSEVAAFAESRAKLCEKEYPITAECLRSWKAYLEADPDFTLRQRIEALAAEMDGKRADDLDSDIGSLVARRLREALGMTSHHAVPPAGPAAKVGEEVKDTLLGHTTYSPAETPPRPESGLSLSARRYEGGDTAGSQPIRKERADTPSREGA